MGNEESSGQTVSRWLERQFPDAKRITLRRMVAAGRVLIDGKPARQFHQPVAAGQTLSLSNTPAAGGRRADPPGGKRLPFSIVHEDSDVLVVHKSAGMLTSTNERERRPTLLAAVTRYLSESDRRARVGLIHRLDRDAAGLLVFSKNDAAYRSLKSQLLHREMDREYLAVVAGSPAEMKGQIETRLIERADGSVHSTNAPGKGQFAATHYEVLEQASGIALLRVKLRTGRKHQIRVHLSERGMPIVGDRLYGAQPPAGPLRLLATTLGFVHPRSGGAVRFEISPPRDFWAGTKKAGGEPPPPAKNTIST